MEVRITDWQHAREDARAIRTEVFIREQKVPEEMEWDDDDLTAVHFVIYDDGTPAGCARLLPDGHFGRMAVRREWQRAQVSSWAGEGGGPFRFAEPVSWSMTQASSGVPRICTVSPRSATSAAAPPSAQAT